MAQKVLASKGGIINNKLYNNLTTLQINRYIKTVSATELRLDGGRLTVEL